MPVSMRSHFHYWKDIINQKFPFFTKVTVGESPDYLEVQADNGIQLYGDTTVWNDIQSSLLGDRIDSPVGTVDFNYNENTVDFLPSGSLADSTKRLIFNIQLPHSVKTDSNLSLHIHWEQTDATARTWAVQYRIQNNGQPKTTTWTTITTSTSVGNRFTYTSGTLNQVTEIGAIDLTGAGLSAVVEFRLTRTDAVAGVIRATFIDCHYEQDVLGSREEYLK